jgi:hypothetical protein
MASDAVWKITIKVKAVSQRCCRFSVEINCIEPLRPLSRRSPVNGGRIANRVLEAIAGNCSFVARTMPRQTLIQQFVEGCGNGPDRPGHT